MKKILTYLLSVFLLSCSYSNNNISTLIEKELLKTNGKSIQLSNITSFQWQRVCIIGPYSMQENQDRVLGFENDLLVNANDRVSTLVFVNNNKVVEYVHHPRNKGDFLQPLKFKPCYINNETIYLKY